MRNSQAIDKEIKACRKPQWVYAAANYFDPQGTFRFAVDAASGTVLARGNVETPGPVAPRALSCVPGLRPASTSILRRRKASGGPRWPSGSPTQQHADVAVDCESRLALSLRRGLVDTPNDFGHMGSLPTHPELLDWLAVEFRDSGGSFKKLHKLIVMSAVYRQASADNAANAQDRWRQSLSVAGEPAAAGRRIAARHHPRGQRKARPHDGRSVGGAVLLQRRPFAGLRLRALRSGCARQLPPQRLPLHRAQRSRPVHGALRLPRCLDDHGQADHHHHRDSGAGADEQSVRAETGGASGRARRRACAISRRSGRVAFRLSLQREPRPRGEAPTCWRICRARVSKTSAVFC